MRDQEIIGLWEAYQQVHAQPEEYVDEIVERVADDTGETGRGPRLIDAYNKAPYSDDKDSAKNPIPIKLKRKGPKMKGVVRKEETDLFDYLLEYLVAEGYADTNKAALAIMANMSEEWKQSIVEGVRPGEVETPLDMKKYRERRRSLAGREASADAKERGHVDKFTGKPYGTKEAASRRKDIHKPEKAPEREARRKAEEDPD